MSFKSDGHEIISSKDLLILQNDFKNLSNETRKKFPLLKESCEEAIAKLSSANNSNQQNSVHHLVNQILYPLIQGCETKDVKIIKFVLGMMQRLITQQVVDQKGAIYITDAMWMLMENNLEDVKVLQTIALLLTTNSIVHGETLAKSLVLCFRLHYSKDSTTSNIAGATIRQLVSLVFERVIQSKNSIKTEDSDKTEYDTCSLDAFLLFQDLINLINADQPIWLCGITEMTRTFGLELIEAILTNFSSIFFDNPKFTQLLKEQVCALAIKLFSPNIKHRTTNSTGISASSSPDKPCFPLTMRLLRVVSVLIERFHSILVTECEIFLSLIVKFLDLDKPYWQRALALEIIHHMMINPNLIVFLCQSYDLKDHATNIFQDITSALGSYVQNFQRSLIAQNNQNQQTTANLQPSAGITNQCGFLVNGIWVPLVVTYLPGKAKFNYLEMLDKMEPPTISDGYGMSIVYCILMDITFSLMSIINIKNPKSPIDDSDDVNNVKDENNKILHSQLIASSWSGLLKSFMCLLDWAADDQTVAKLLASLQDYASLCGSLNILNPRDAFVTAICKSTFPSTYALSVFNIGQQDNNDFRCAYKLKTPNELNTHLVEAGNGVLPIGLSSVNVPQGPVMLNAKNLQCMKAILNLAYYRGYVLGTSWHIVLATLQHLVCILGLRPTTGGSLQISSKIAVENNSNSSNVGIQTAVMADLPVLSQMLSQVFESSQELDDVALHHLIDALCKLSLEAMELAYTNREPSLFAVAKLLETGLVNMFRIEILWRPLTNHLLEVCQHRHIRMREWGVEAITYLVKVALQYKYEVPLKENMCLQTMLLSPLYQLSSVPHGDVRQKQLECVLQILNSSGDILSFGWPLLIEIIGAVNDLHGEPLIRIAFQCLQLVVTDFLPVMPWRCLPICINTAAKFGSQTQELNISLTAIGLMWNISDYFNQNQEKLVQADVGDLLILPDFPGITAIPQFDKLWMCLYAKMGDLCVDTRPAVRKSAGQTLFSTISAHGTLLCSQTWQGLVWHVLFPLLDKVRNLSSTASNEKVDTSGNILIHHSRNTAQKQWAETHVLILSGVSRVFNSQRSLLQHLGDFARAWSLILEFIQNAALNKIDEVSLAALKSMQEIMFYGYEQQHKDSNYCESTTDNKIDNNIWIQVWKVWLNIGMESTNFADNENHYHYEFYLPNQSFLTALVQIFPAIFQHIRETFSLDDFQKLSKVLTNVIEIPYQSDSVPYIMSNLSDSLLTPLHDAVLDCVDLIQKEATKDNSSMRNIIPSIFEQLLMFSKLTCLSTTNEIESKFKKYANCYTSNSSTSMEFSHINYIPFGEKSLTLVVKLYQKTANEDVVVDNQILEKIVRTLHVPLALKYNCVSSTTWKLAISCLFKVLQTGLKVARCSPKKFTGLWDVLADCFDKFLFPTSICTIEDRGLEEIVLDESIDCQVIDLLKEEILPFSHEMPHEFIIKIVVLLNKGSIHSAAETTSICCESDWKLREMFAKTCFETLLQFSLLEDSSKNDINCNNKDKTTEKEYFAGKLAVTALLHRFLEVLKKFNEDERQSGKCPLPRYRLSEISFVLKAIETLIISMKKAPSCKVNKTAWNQIISLYPFLVDCTTTTSQDVSRALRDTLLQYTELLQTPKYDQDKTELKQSKTIGVINNLNDS